ncbi:olfactory receptor 1019-like [Spea bombifrons]|uniref:olfactory receptor 1019-like n=1 Tax=Spea bombifrons TaxID=233779 RepID=UPI00234955F0|nr:olfactory receptor 1019-like [Spea bombifrons]
MDETNQTMVQYFIIKGISDAPSLQLPIFLLILIIYFLILGGNMTIFLLVCSDSQLHTPMYFFLCNLSVLDMCCSTVTLHYLLVMYVTGNNVVSFVSCMAQVFFFASFTSNELLILTAMSYDRFMAICNPLHYRMVMSMRMCSVLAFASWSLGFIEIIPYMVLILNIFCYRSNVINHFFCDIMPVIKLSCSDTSALETLIFTEGLFLLSFTPLILTCISYTFIIVTILRIRSSTGRRKAFYTCSSHLTVVILLYMSLFLQYLRPFSIDTLDSGKLFSLVNTVAVPTLNPVIYSLKNKDVKSAVKRKLKHCKS